MGGFWFACEQPERANDASIMWHCSGCHGCAIKAEATKRLYFEDLTLVHLDILDRIIAGNIAA